MQIRQVSEVAAAQALRSSHAVYVALTEEPLVADLGDWWPLVHVALTGEAPMPRDVAHARDVEWDDDSFENVLMGGEATSYADDLSFARVMKPRDVLRWSARLAEVSPRQLADSLDHEMMSFAPRGADLEEARHELTARFTQLRACYLTAATAGHALLVAVI